MKAIQVNAPGGIEELKYVDCEIPECGPNDALVNIKMAGVNFIDIYYRKGLYKPAAYPYIPGKEGSGIIVEIGKNVTSCKVGDRVAFCFAGSGSYAEYACIPADQLVKLPEEISFEIAAAAMLQGLTAYYLSHLTFKLNHSDTALIHAGAGGVGLLLIQMAKLLNAYVITTVSNDKKAALAKTAGANDVILYTKESFKEHVMAITNNKGVDVVYDAVGQTTFEDSLNSLAVRGMLVSYGQASGPIPPFNLARLSEKSLYITRPVLGHYIQGKSLFEMSHKLFEFIIKRKLHISIGQQYPLKSAATVHHDLETRATTGKLLLLVE